MIVPTILITAYSIILGWVVIKGKSGHNIHLIKLISKLRKKD